MKTLIYILSFIPCLVHAARFVVEAKHMPKLSPQIKIEKFYPTNDPYFSRLYIVSGEVTKNQLGLIPGVQLVEESPELLSMSIVPSKNAPKIVEDELFGYQWGLLNQGQIYYREKDDIHNLSIPGVDGKDIGWNQLINNLNNSRPVVAVLDSGVDLNHPDLKDNLWKNKSECGKDNQVDNDGNRLAGDCHGWNFTEAMDSSEAKNPSDNDGHGTHIAGIIAAALNGRGIVGVNPHALIMPIKVMKDAQSDSAIPSSESFARGIIYAVDNGAQIINMSLGWPRSLETKFLRESVSYALRQGVIIVAAAGNNNSTEPLFPCAYEGVICVAATTIDGKYADFSNYGGHVDISAPGEGIVSTHPTVLEPDYFSLNGYEIRSGTSQSTPFVTGLIAAIVGQKPQITIDEILARIYNLEPSKDATKYVLGGEAHFVSLNKEVNGPVIRPILKRVRQVLLKDNRAQISIPIRNFGSSSGQVEVGVESLSDSLKISSEMKNISSLEAGETRDLIFDAIALDLSKESHIVLKVTVKFAGKELSFVNQVPVLRDIRGDSELTKTPFSFTSEPLPLGGIKNAEMNSFLTTLDHHGPSSEHQFFLKRILKINESKKLELTLFTRTEDRVEQAPRLLLVDDVLNVVNFKRVDLNLDGDDDYFVHTLCEKNNKKFFKFSFYNSKLEPLWLGLQDVILDLDIYVKSMNEITFIRYKHPQMGVMLVPAFFTEGAIPTLDQIQNSWEKADNTPKQRLYFLEPRSNKFVVRTLTSPVWEQLVKKEFNTKWFETIELEQILPESSDDLKNNALRVLVSIGFNTKRKLVIFKFNDSLSVHGPVLPQLVLQTDKVDPLLKVSEKGFEVVGDVYFNIYDRDRSKLVRTQELSQQGELIYRLENQSDLIAGHLASFETSHNIFSIIQTKEELVSFNDEFPSKIGRRPKIRYSFLSLKLLTEMYSPVIYNRNGIPAPALYVDSTAVTGNRINLLEERSGKLVSSLKNALSVPANCKALNPRFNSSSSAHEFVFLCLENGEWFLNTLTMN
jgi:cell wall-associated protease